MKLGYFITSTLYFWVFGCIIDRILMQSEYKFDIILITTLIINVFTILTLQIALRNKQYISERDEHLNISHFIYFISTSCINAATFWYIYNFLLLTEVINLPFPLTIVWFIAKSFCYELTFDLFHYIMHRIFHYKLLYRYFHKTHHTDCRPAMISTFYQDPVDLFFSNTLTLVLTQWLIPFNSLEFSVFTIYKVFVEVAGHSGKIYNASSFTQCVWLAKFINIDLRTEDHDRHHTPNNCNYGKRFTIWDKVFSTYYLSEN